MTGIGSFETTVNRVATVLAAAIFVALGAWWWIDRSRTYEAPRWEPARFAALAAPERGALGRPGWIVIVNPGCPHCRARLADLARRDAAGAQGAALGALVVDTPERPATLDLGPGLAAGIWWDSLAVWRGRWGHRVYGETLVFDTGGALARTIPPDGDVAAPAPNRIAPTPETKGGDTP